MKFGWDAVVISSVPNLLTALVRSDGKGFIEEGISLSDVDLEIVSGLSYPRLLTL
jgi:hypothetical protein